MNIVFFLTAQTETNQWTSSSTSRLRQKRANEHRLLPHCSDRNEPMNIIFFLTAQTETNQWTSSSSSRLRQKRTNEHRLLPYGSDRNEPINIVFFLMAQTETNQWTRWMTSSRREIFCLIICVWRADISLYTSDKQDRSYRPNSIPKKMSGRQRINITHLMWWLTKDTLTHASMHSVTASNSHLTIRHVFCKHVAVVMYVVGYKNRFVLDS